MDRKGIGIWASVRPQVISWNTEIGRRMGNLGLSRRIVTASDDASGAALATRLGAKGDSLQSGRSNSLGAIATARAASGELGRAGEGLGRMRELATRAASGTLSDVDRAGLDAELQALRGELGDLLGSATFGGLELFSGETLLVQVGAEVGDTLALKLPDAGAFTGLAGSSLASQDEAGSVVASLDAAIEAVAVSQSELGAAEAALGSAATQASEAIEHLARAESRIVDADIAEETAELAGDRLRRHALLALGLHDDIDDALVMKLLE